MAIKIFKYLIFLTFCNCITSIIYALNVNPKVYSLTGVLVGNKIYYHGGLQKTGTDYFITNILLSTNIINSSKIITESDFSSSYHNAFHIASTSSDKIYFFGGRHSHLTDDNELLFGRYDIQDNNLEFVQKSTESPFNLQDSSCAMTKNGLFVIFGGKTRLLGNIIYSKDIYITNTNSENWGSHWIKPIFTNGPGPRISHSATILPDGRMIMLGGQTNDSFLIPMSEIWIYNINRNEWQNITVKGDIPSPRCGHSTILTSDNKIIIYGGTSDVNVSHSLAVLDTSVWSWSLPKIIDSQNVKYWNTSNTIGKQMTIVFGNEQNFDSLDDITILNITTWSIGSTFVSEESSSSDEEISSSNGQITFIKRDTNSTNTVDANSNGTIIIIVTFGIVIIVVGSIVYILYHVFMKRKKHKKKRKDRAKKRNTAADHISMVFGLFGKTFESNNVAELELGSVIEPLNFDYNLSASNDDSRTGTTSSPISRSPVRKQIPQITPPKPILESSSRSNSSTKSQSSSNSSRIRPITTKDIDPIPRPRQIYRINSRTFPT